MEAGNKIILGAPVNVSPLIRLSRWSLLLVGILYGVKHNSTLSKREAEWRIEEAKREVVRKAKRDAEKARLDREELLQLAKEVGIPVPADF